MTAFILVLASAVIHATWNLFAKRAGGGAAFVWLFAIGSSILYLPVAIVLFITQSPSLNLTTLFFMLGSGALHVVYFLLLQQGYRVGDLSLVYPLARGTGPMISTAAAVLVFGERPGLIGLLGVALIGVGAFLLTGKGKAGKQQGTNYQAIAYGLLTGAVIAAYTLWDKQGVSALLVPPLLMDYGANLSRVVILTPIALYNWQEVRSEWRIHRREVLAIAFLSPLAYILTLTALSFTPVSYVAPMREISILFGVLMGTRLLAEGEGKRKLIAAVIMVVGVIAIALNR
jgi:drug/metabolite transporter (DMT)-like permease